MDVAARLGNKEAPTRDANPGLPSRPMSKGAASARQAESAGRSKTPAPADHMLDEAETQKVAQPSHTGLNSHGYDLLLRPQSRTQA